MSSIGKKERETQDRVIALFHKELDYSYLGNWEDRPNNSNIEETILRKCLRERKRYNNTLINKALYELGKAANNLSDGLYSANKKVYQLLRYGAKVKAEAGENYETIELIDWKHPLENEFAIAEEVTIQGNREKRPDIVLYVNGIALGVLVTETKHDFRRRWYPTAYCQPAERIHPVLLHHHSMGICRE